MPEKIYRMVNGEPAEIGARDPARRYRYRQGPGGENAYIEFTAAEDSRRDADEAKHAEEMARPRVPTIEERLTEAEARIAALEKR